MLNNDEMILLLGNLPVRSNKSATSKAPMKLSVEQANVLGAKKRQLLRYVKIAINAISDKMEIQTIAINDVQSNDSVDTWLKVNQFENLQKDLYKALVRDGKTYVLVAHNNNNPTLTQVDSYDGNTGATTIKVNNAPLYTVNVWNNGIQRNVDIYYPERIEKYYYDTNDASWTIRRDTPDEAWPIDWTDNNNQPLGIALVEFDIGESDITEAVQLQSDMNEALLDMLATSRTSGWPQRVLKNASKETYLLNQYEQPIFGTNTGYPIPRKIELTPGSILMLQGADSDLVQLAAAEVNTTAIDKLIEQISFFTTVPLFYFKDSGQFPSGVALVQAESKLNHKVESHQAFITPAFETMITLMLRVNNTFANTSYNVDTDIAITWFSPMVETDDLRMAKQESLTKNLVLLMGAGLISTETAVRMLHPTWSESEVQAELARISVAIL